MQRPKVNGILRSLAMLCTLVQTAFLVFMIIGDTIGVQEVSAWVQHVGVTVAIFCGFFTLIVLAVYDNV